MVRGVSNGCWQNFEATSLYFSRAGHSHPRDRVQSKSEAGVDLKPVMLSVSSMRRSLAVVSRSAFSQSKSQAFDICRLGHSLLTRPLVTGSFRTGAAPVDLRYDVLHPDHSSKTERPLVILHGLLCVSFLRFFSAFVPTVSLIVG